MLFDNILGCSTLSIQFLFIFLSLLFYDFSKSLEYQPFNFFLLKMHVKFINGKVVPLLDSADPPTFMNVCFNILKEFDANQID